VVRVRRRRFRPSGRPTGRIRQTVSATDINSRDTLLPAIVHQQQVRAGVLFFGRTSDASLLERFRRLDIVGGGRDGGRRGPADEDWRAFGSPRRFGQHGLCESGTSALRLPLQVDQGLQVWQVVSGRRRWRGGGGRASGSSGVGLAFAAVVERIPSTDGFQKVLSGLAGSGPRQFGTGLVFQYAVFAF